MNYNLYSSLNIVARVKSWRLRRKDHNCDKHVQNSGWKTSWMETIWEI